MLLRRTAVAGLAFVNTLAARGANPSKSEVYTFVEARTRSWNSDPTSEAPGARQSTTSSRD